MRAGSHWLICWGSGWRPWICSTACNCRRCWKCAAGLRPFRGGTPAFAVSRQDKRNPNDADRLRKYLARFGLDWAQIRA